MSLARCASKDWEVEMGKGMLLWLIGVPIPVIIILYFVFR